MTKQELIAEIEKNGKKLNELQAEYREIQLKTSLLRYDLKLTDAKRFETEAKNFGSKKEPDIHQVTYMVFDQEFHDDDDDPDSPFIIERKMPVEIDGRKCNEHWQFIEPETK